MVPEYDFDPKARMSGRIEGEQAAPGSTAQDLGDPAKQLDIKDRCIEYHTNSIEISGDRNVDSRVPRPHRKDVLRSFVGCPGKLA
jgi:hypothetical protein